MTLVILDRDGVINADSADYVKSAEEWQPLPGSIEAIARLSQAGFQVAVATNQSGLGRGLFDLDDLEAMHDKMRELVFEAGGQVDAVFYCPHTPADECLCRKPAPGLLDAIAETFAQDLAGEPLVGDSLRDLEAGAKRRCRLFLVRTGKGARAEIDLADRANLAGTRVFDDLSQVADFLLSESEPAR